MNIGNSGFTPFQGLEHRDLLAFIGLPRQFLLKPGELLCRFITAESTQQGHHGNQIFGSPWWHSMHAFMHIYNLSKTAQAPLGDAARARLAIVKKFNPTMEYFCQIVITRDIYGWLGRAKYQPEEGTNLLYMGGAEQIYLPNLASDSTGMSSNYAVLKYFGPTDMLG